MAQVDKDIFFPLTLHFIFELTVNRSFSPDRSFSPGRSLHVMYLPQTLSIKFGTCVWVLAKPMNKYTLRDVEGNLFLWETHLCRYGTQYFTLKGFVFKTHSLKPWQVNLPWRKLGFKIKRDYFSFIRLVSQNVFLIYPSNLHVQTSINRSTKWDYKNIGTRLLDTLPGLQLTKSTKTGFSSLLRYM